MAFQSSAAFSFNNINNAVPGSSIGGIDWPSLKLDSTSQPSSSDADVDSYLDVYNILRSFYTDVACDSSAEANTLAAPPLTLNRDQFPGRVPNAHPRSLDVGNHSNFSANKESYDFSRLASPQLEHPEFEEDLFDR